ncbi:MAG: hypothetical protein AAFX08_05340 [Pseudomonadota bacterium]
MMGTDTDLERDRIAWFRIGIVAISAFTGLALLVSGARPAALVFLGYAVFAAALMFIFRTWRSSGEVDKVNRKIWKRMLRNAPRGVLRFFVGYLAFIAVVALGSIPLFFVSNETHSECETFLNAYIYFLVGLSITFFFWVGGLLQLFRQMLSDLRELRDAARRAQGRRRSGRAN